MKNFYAGRVINQGYYKCFVPEPINREWVFDDESITAMLEEVNILLDRLNKKVNRLNEESSTIDLDHIILKEATYSSVIEGVKINLYDAQLPREEIPVKMRDDWDEVHFCVEALKWAIDQLDALPFSSRMFTEIHAAILQGVRGEKREPGQYRVSQNWFGGSSLKDAIYIPPAHNYIADLISDLEKFAHNDQIELHHLIKIGIIHYQFYAIQPFLTANGRVSRVLIPLYLIDNKVIDKPYLSMSEYFLKNRNLYFDYLSLVRERGDIGEWIKFFLKGIIESAAL